MLYTNFQKRYSSAFFCLSDELIHSFVWLRDMPWSPYPTSQKSGDGFCLPHALPFVCLSNVTCADSLPNSQKTEDGNRRPHDPSVRIRIHQLEDKLFAVSVRALSQLQVQGVYAPVDDQTGLVCERICGIGKYVLFLEAGFCLRACMLESAFG